MVCIKLNSLKTFLRFRFCLRPGRRNSVRAAGQHDRRTLLNLQRHQVLPERVHRPTSSRDRIWRNQWNASPATHPAAVLLRRSLQKDRHNRLRLLKDCIRRVQKWGRCLVDTQRVWTGVHYQSRHQADETSCQRAREHADARKVSISVLNLWLRKLTYLFSQRKQEAFKVVSLDTSPIFSNFVFLSDTFDFLCVRMILLLLSKTKPWALVQFHWNNIFKNINLCHFPCFTSFPSFLLSFLKAIVREIW